MDNDYENLTGQLTLSLCLSSSLSIIKLKLVILIGAQRSEESPFER